MKYFALSSIMHDGKNYGRGEALELSDKQAKDLLDAGVIQTEEVKDAPKPAAAAPQEEAPDPKVGGGRAESGEPSLDTPEAPQRAEAKDVGPKVSEDMTRKELEKAARKEGVSKDDVAAASTKADIVELIEKKRAQEPAAPAAPEVDASADL